MALSSPFSSMHDVYIIHPTSSCESDKGKKTRKTKKTCMAVPSRGVREQTNASRSIGGRIRAIWAYTTAGSMKSRRASRVGHYRATLENRGADRFFGCTLVVSAKSRASSSPSQKLTTKSKRHISTGGGPSRRSACMHDARTNLPGRPRFFSSESGAESGKSCVVDMHGGISSADDAGR